MISVYKKELKSYFSTYIGYTFIALFTLSTGIYSWFVNFKNQSPNFEYVIYNLAFLFLITIPILTMKSFSDEYKQKTDRLLFSLPLRLIDIVLGKYLASITVLFISCILVTIIPITLCFFGNISFATCIGTLIGFFMLGCTLISICIFISSQCKNPIISATLSFIIIFLIYLTPTISTAFTSSNFLTAIISSVALFDRLILFVSGVFDLTSVFFYVCVSVVFVLLTTLSTNKNKSTITKAIITVVLILLTVIFNIAINAIPTLYTHIDTSDDKLFTISEWTKNEIKDLKDDVNIYYLCLNKIEDENIAEILSKYQDYSDKISVQTIDTATNPYFYADYTENEPADNSIIVSCNKKSYCIDYYDIYEYTNNSTNFDGEGELTAAIKYVTSDRSAILYTLEGHEETVLSNDLSDSIKKENVEIKSLNLTTANSVPDDADCVLVYSPKRDISSDVKSMLINYMSNGGKIIILKDYTQDNMPVFDSFLTEYGLKIEKGIVQEQNSTLHYPSQPYTIIPTVLPHAITQPIIDSNLTVLFPFAGGITFTNTEASNLSVEAFIATEETAYSTLNLSETTRNKQEGDINGPFAFAVEVTYNEAKTPSSLILYSTSLFLSDNANKLVGGANIDLFLNTINHVCQSDSTPAIRSKVLLSQSISVSEFASLISFIIFVIIIPFIVIASGILVIYKRKTR